MAISGEPGSEVVEPSGDSEEEVASMAISGEPSPEVGEPLSGGEEDVVTVAISDDPSPEVDEPPGGGEEDAVSMAISSEPGPEVGEPPPTWPPLFASSSARSDNLLSLPARGGESSIKRCSPASEAPPTASPKDNMAVPTLRSC
jgi:hypothetical protein